MIDGISDEVERTDILNCTKEITVALFRSWRFSNMIAPSRPYSLHPEET